LIARRHPGRSEISILVNKFEISGNAIDNKKDVFGEKSVRTPENIHSVEQALKQSPRKSVQITHMVNMFT
jgi:hypothetical protein